MPPGYSDRVTSNRVLVAATAVMALSLGACASDEQPVAPQTLPPATVSASKLTIEQPTRKGSETILTGSLTNTRDAPIVVVGGSAYYASQVRVLRTEASDGKRTASPQPLAIDAQQTVRLRRNGTYLQIVELTESLKPGSSVPFNVMTQDGSSVTVTADVATE